MALDPYKLKITAEKAELVLAALEAIDQATLVLQNIIPNLPSFTAIIANLQNIIDVKNNEININATNANKINIDLNATNIVAIKNAAANAQTALDEAASAVISATSSEVSNNSSKDRLLEAQSWSNEAEDVPVKTFINGIGANIIPIVYSAFHWKQKALAIANANISALNDVDTTGKIDNDFLGYDATIGKWIPRGIKNDLLSTDINKPLSANQGKVLKGLIDNFDSGAFSHSNTLGDIVISTNQNVAFINPVTFASLTVQSGAILKII